MDLLRGEVTSSSRTEKGRSLFNLVFALAFVTFALLALRLPGVGKRGDDRLKRPSEREHDLARLAGYLDR